MWAINGHHLRPSSCKMGEGRVPELCSAILDSTFGSIYIGGPCELTQHQEGGKNLRAAKAVVACMFSQRLLSAY